MTNIGKGAVKASIELKILTELVPTRLVVVDESDLHAGHGGHRSSGESHFRLEVISDAFRGKSRVQRHRLIHEILSAELANSVHALSITALSPEEQV